MTSGLDPTTSKYLADFVSELKNQGKTIVFSAHNLYQVESLCDYVMEFSVDKKLDFEAVRNNGNFIARTNDLEEFNRITGWVAKNNGKIIDIKTVYPPLRRYS